MEIIQAMQLKVLPCRGCEACRETGKCVLKDDVDWILEKTCVEDCGLIVAVPVYHLRANGLFMAISDRMGHVFQKNPDLLRKTRVGAIISIGNSDKDWTTLNLATINIFVQHTRLLVDQIEVNRALLRGAVLRLDKALQRARELGRNVARAMSMPIEEVKYMGEETAVSCPVCHCNILQIPRDFPHVACPICWVRGLITFNGSKMNVEWNEEDIKYPRFSYEGERKHRAWTAERLPTEEQYLETGKAKELMKKYCAYGKIIRP